MDSFLALFGKVETKAGDCNELLCPKCGENYTHHGRVTVYDRGEDGVVTIVTSVGREVITGRQVSAHCNNPSSRRHGIRIEMSCEHCGDCPDLVILQHKGYTIVEWDMKSAGL